MLRHHRWQDRFLLSYVRMLMKASAIILLDDFQLFSNCKECRQDVCLNERNPNPGAFQLLNCSISLLCLHRTLMTSNPQIRAKVQMATLMGSEGCSSVTITYQITLSKWEVGCWGCFGGNIGCGMVVGWWESQLRTHRGGSSFLNNGLSNGQRRALYIRSRSLDLALGGRLFSFLLA